MKPKNVGNWLKAEDFENLSRVLGNMDKSDIQDMEIHINRHLKAIEEREKKLKE